MELVRRKSPYEHARLSLNLVQEVKFQPLLMYEKTDGNRYCGQRQDSPQDNQKVSLGSSIICQKINQQPTKSSELDGGANNKRSVVSAQ